jgi:outer membrane lipoprotein carrier protein
MRFLILAVTATVAAAQAPVDTLAVLKGVEKRYNSISTLKAEFTHTYKDRGRTRAPERGTVYLSKPNRTRWEYAEPAGNLFVSDGKFTYNYDRRRNAVEREPFRETEDLRIPLSFLLGKLDFQKDFDEFRARREGDDAVITAIPRNKKLLFKEIVMRVAPDSALRRVTVVGQEGSEMDYAFQGEQRNPKLPDSLFRFTLPAGAQVLDAGQ